MQLIVNFMPYVNGAGVITCYTGIPDSLTHWQLVSYDPGTGEGVPYGSLKEEVVRTNKDGYAVNSWLGPTDPLAAGKIDRVKIRSAE